MENSDIEKRIEQLLLDEKNKLLVEIHEAVEKKKSFMKKDDEPYRKRRW